MEVKKKHLLEYILLICVSAVFLTLFILFRSDKEFLKLLSGLISSTYVLWGIIHSALEGRLSRLIVFEYFLFGTLVFLILFFALSF